jgi:hypothetical protein
MQYVNMNFPPRISAHSPIKNGCNPGPGIH